MNQFKFNNKTTQDVLEDSYDFAFFANGYEERCTYVSKKILFENISNTVVIRFEEVPTKIREEHDRYFNQLEPTYNIALSANSDSKIFNLLNGLDLGGKNIKILVDYSSMSRLWYAAVLYWAANLDIEVQIDFLYSTGNYKSKKNILVISDILAIPGFEGAVGRFEKSVSYIGLGFNSDATYNVYDRLESNQTFCFYTCKDQGYAEQVLSLNKYLIEEIGECCLIPLSLDSVPEIFSVLANHLAPNLQNGNVTLVPIGPKPHVLATLLLGLKFQQICCLRVSGSRKAPESIAARGDIYTTSVTFS